MATYLDEILESHRDKVANDNRSLDQLIEKAQKFNQEDKKPRGFVRSIRSSEGLAVIAEIKRRSPSKGSLNEGLDPAEIATQYQDGGATCLSVLTDVDYFGGSVDDLQVARANVPIPVLRKDFTVGPLDVVDARIMGADAILLIVAALDQVELRDFYVLAGELGLDCLIETHDEYEVERAMELEPSLIGVNQRDLKTFEVDMNRALRVVKMLDSSVVKVAESGVRNDQDAAALANGGYDAVLVGESVVSSGDASEAVRRLRQAGHC